MATKKKTSTTSKKSQQEKVYRFAPVGMIKKMSDRFLARRPHRSFRLTKKRDYARSLVLPGYFTFTNSVKNELLHNRKTFFLLALVYAVLSGVLVGITSQATYTTITDSLRQAGTGLFGGDATQIGNTISLLGTALTGGISQTLTATQAVYASLIGLLTWLTTVWLLRHFLAGNKVKLRDGLYNGSAPILSTFLVVLVAIMQLLPMGIAFIGFSAAQSSGLLAGGVEAMLFWIAAGLLVVLSMYWISATFIALVVVTLPGMYPMRALMTAGDLVVGRRFRILLRLLWLMGTIVVSLIIVMVPIVLIDTWLKGIIPAIDSAPIIPIAILIMGSLTVIWASSYVYLLYRKVVADDAKPA